MCYYPNNAVDARMKDYAGLCTRVCSVSLGQMGYLDAVLQPHYPQGRLAFVLGAALAAPLRPHFGLVYLSFA